MGLIISQSLVTILSLQLLFKLFCLLIRLLDFFLLSIFMLFKRWFDLTLNYLISKCVFDVVIIVLAIFFAEKLNSPRMVNHISFLKQTLSILYLLRLHRLYFLRAAYFSDSNWCCCFHTLTRPLTGAEFFYCL